MDKPLDKYYDDRFTLFAEPGWVDLIEDINERIKAIESIKGVDTLETLWKRKGELETLEWLKSLPEVSRQVFDQLKQDGEIK